MLTRRPIGVAAVAAVAATAIALTIAGFWWTADREPSPLAASWVASVHVLAGDGTNGLRDGDSLRAQFTDPFGVAVGPDGLIYVADGAGSDRIRVISREGHVATLAGGHAGLVDGPAHEARFSTPSGLAVDRHATLYVADTGNNAIRRVTRTGDTTTVSGGGAAGFADGPAGEARFNGPIGVAVDGSGRVFVADTYNDRIRVIGTDGVVGTLAGGARGYVDGPAADARFDTPTGLAVHANGTIYVADTGNDRVRAITPNGIASTLIDTSHGLFRPLGLALAVTGELYVVGEDGRLLERTPDGAVRVLAGSTAGFRDGPGRDAQFRHPAGVAWRGPGQLVVTDAGNAMVRTVEAAARADMRPPTLPHLDPRFDVDAFSLRPLLWPLHPLSGPFEVAGTMGEVRGEEAGRFHSGIDVRAEQGENVLASRNGVVQTPLGVSAFGTLNESIRVGPLAYVHVRAGRTRQEHVVDDARFTATHDETGRLSDIRVKRGARFDVGDVVGTVNAFNHVHLNVGWPGEEYNPLLFRLVQYRDSIPPTIAPGGVRLFGLDGQRLTTRSNRRLLVSGDVQIVVDAWDQADGNRPNRRLGLFALGYQVLLPGGTPAPGFDAPRMTMKFDRLSRQPNAAALVYASGSGIPFYGERRTRFLYVVTNRFQSGNAAAGAWRTGELPPGDYTLRIHALDASGNAAQANRDLAITIVARTE
jgi:sugar lactone lactonase YvrE